MNAFDSIKEKLSKRLDIFRLEILDDTHKHLNHRNFDGGLHLNALIVSSSFETLSLLERHQLVYSALGPMIKNEIHALSLKTLTPAEWKEKEPKDL